LRLEFLAPTRDGERVFEDRIVGPEGEVLERWPAGEEVEDAADYGVLLCGERDAGGGGDGWG
jgi:hypothetical protein